LRTASGSRIVRVMHDDLERTAESLADSSGAGRDPHAAQARLEMSDAIAAIALAEKAVGSHVLGADPPTRLAPGASAESLLGEARDAAERGERVAVVARAEALAAARDGMRRIAQARLAVVVHAISGHGGEELSALSDVGWGLLCASGPEDSFDLALIARRAAEDSGVPFVVVHAHGHAELGTGRAHAMVALPDASACSAFVGPASRMKPRHDPAHPSLSPIGDRTFAERVPFALASALREYANVSGRRHDVFDKMPLGEAPLMLVGMGPVGDALFHSVAELRARGYDVGAVHVSALRPFPGARLVKTLARALAITVLEPADEPMSHGGLLARELKSAFTDALTWAPGFPGIGRIPKLFVGVTGASFDVADLAAICDNMLADERGRRSFSFSDTEHALPRATSPETATSASTSVSMRWVLDDVASAEMALSTTAAVLASALGLRAHGIVTPHPGGGGATVDVFAAREHTRGGMARRGPKLVLTTTRGIASSAAVAPLTPGAVLGVLSAGGDPTLPDAARTIVRERRVRALALAYGGAAEDVHLAIAATCAGAALAVGSRAQKILLDGVQVARAVAEHLGTRGITDAGPAAERARRAFEATLESLATAERDGAANLTGDRTRNTTAS
jgi:pyruvate ferredoxin oxidoreductase alpha subunit